MFLATTLALYFSDSDPGMVGLAINYTLLTPTYLQWVVRFWSELEMYFNAVERVLHYSHLRKENDRQDVTLVITNWPTVGRIQFDNVSATYDDNSPPTVKDFNLDIKAGQMVGICGRTGSGKSTVAHCLFRLVDITAGRIRLDNVDITTVEPRWLRSRLSVVPQDPLMIAGTLRDNLDPELKCDDKEIWSVLESVSLKETLTPIGLGRTFQDRYRVDITTNDCFLVR